MQTMKLTGSELRFLLFLAKRGKTRLSEAAPELQELPSQTSRLMAALQGKNFVRAERTGVSKIVSISEFKHAALLRKLVLEFEHIPFDELLSGVSLEVLSAICFLSLKNRKEIADHCLVSEASVARTIERLKQVGIIEKGDSGYGVSHRFQSLKDFVMEYRHYVNQKTAEHFAEDAVVHWECNNEFIIETKRSQGEGRFHETGSSAFGKYGVPLLSQSAYFFHSPLKRKLGLEDVILHYILLQNQTQLPVLLVWMKNHRRIDMAYLRQAGEKYGEGKLIDGIGAYLESRGRERTPDLPPWDEFLLRAKEYGIS
jgi:DNA-binding MarR family transcriptional regulator